jgi:bifunctional pyridoxal-dependent enzyme with beta-cystathionase and maltose regulon repressor activities
MMDQARFDPPPPERLRDGHGAKWTAIDADVIPAWVADMDLGIPPAVRAHLADTLDRQDLGYPYWPGPDPVVEAFADRMESEYQWSPTPGRARVMSDLIQILQVVIEYTTDPGDSVAVHVPCYPPFLAAIHRAGRRIAPLRISRVQDGWHVDLERDQALFEQYRPRLLLLVNPHNPTGHVFGEAELVWLAELAAQFGTTVMSDEIHADLAYSQRRHIPFASLDSAIAAFTITATSATKAFNLAGLRCAVAHFGHAPTFERIEAAPLDFFGTPSVLSRVATVAAWRESREWHQSLMGLLSANRDRVARWALTQPGVSFAPPDATYLAWLDFGGTPLIDGATPDPAGVLLRDARVQLSPGRDFGHHATGVPEDETSTHARLNFATTPDVLEKVLGRITSAIREYEER